MGQTIFQPTDLRNKRVEVLKAAREGKALIRDNTTGTGLVMLPESDLSVLETFTLWSLKLEHLRLLVYSGEQINVSDLGDLAWLRVFDNDDLQSFCAELSDELIACYADHDFTPLSQFIQSWKTTAQQLDDPLRKKLLLQDSFTDADFIPAQKPDAPSVV